MSSAKGMDINMINSVLSDRMKEFKRNERLEEYMKNVNEFMVFSEKKALEQVNLYAQPIIFVVGPLRSGTTLMTQWLLSTGRFACATNMMSRFYESPIMAAKIQKLLTDEKYSFRDELYDIQHRSSYESVYGKTKGFLEPNEFWYFWRRFVPDDACLYTDEQLYNNTDIDLMRKEFYGIADEFEKPFVIKAGNCNFNIGFLNKVFPKALFIYIKRNIEKNVKSALEARRRYYNDERKWYSFIVPEYDEIIKIKDPEIQVRRQIESIHRGIRDGLKVVEEEKKVVVQYEEFCENPNMVYSEIRKKLRQQNYYIGDEYIGVKKFLAR